MDPRVKYLIVFGMLTTGTINTLLNKFQDLQCVAIDTSSCDPIRGPFFEQPLLQTLNMFVGEILCLGLFYTQYLWNSWKLTRSNDYHQVATDEVIQEEEEEEEEEQDLTQNLLVESSNQTPLLEGWNQLWFLIPTLCDLTATTLMNVGLMFVSASIYQMLRGSVVLFTGIFSTFFLGIKHPRYRWFGLIIVFTGVAIVGMSSLFKSSTYYSAHHSAHFSADFSSVHAYSSATTSSESSPYQALGILMVILAQCFTASQFVIEEKIMHTYTLPSVKAVGLEGLFGLCLTILAVPILHYTIGIHHPPGIGNVFDMNESFRELIIPNIFYAAIGICFSISLFNWCGLAVTQSISATSRSTIDTCRTLFIWIISLLLGWESFSFLQVLGFIVLIYGTFIFNDVIQAPLFMRDDREIQLVEDVLVAPAELSPTNGDSSTSD